MWGHCDWHYANNGQTRLCECVQLCVPECVLNTYDRRKGYNYQNVKDAQNLGEIFLLAFFPVKSLDEKINSTFLVFGES